MKRPFTLRPARKSVLCAGLIAFFVSGFSSRAHAGVTFNFMPIAINLGDNTPAINDNGVVAFEGRFSLTTNGVYSGSGGPLTTIGAGVSTAEYNVWINDSNQVAFVNNPALGVFSVSRGTGGTPTTIHTYVPGSEGVYTLPVISDDGTVTYLATGTGFFSGTGGSVSTVRSISGSNSVQYSSTFQGLAVSHNGTLAYEVYPSASATTGQQIIVNRAGVETPVITLSASLANAAGVESLAVNNSGVVAMAGELSFTDHGLYLADGSSVTRVAGLGFAVDEVSIASINDLGNYAFLGGYISSNTQFTGIFTGPDPVQDKIIQTGDSLDGSVVTKLDFGTDGLNDNGAVAFWAQLANGTTGIFTATPVPEPASIMILALGVLGLLSRRRKVKCDD